MFHSFSSRAFHCINEISNFSAYTLVYVQILSQVNGFLRLMRVRMVNRMSYYRINYIRILNYYRMNMSNDNNGDRTLHFTAYWMCKLSQLVVLHIKNLIALRGSNTISEYYNFSFKRRQFSVKTVMTVEPWQVTVSNIWKNLNLSIETGFFHMGSHIYTGSFFYVTAVLVARSCDDVIINAEPDYSKIKHLI